MRIPATPLVLALALNGTTSLAGDAGSTTAAVSPVEVVETMEKNFGIHPGMRRNHAKGVCATGTFTATPEAATLSRSPLFSGKPLPVTARFSLAGGRPATPDTTRSPRGMALRYTLPNGSFHMMAMLNVPVFGAATPTTFLDSLKAGSPDPATGKPDPEKLRAFAASHPDARNLADFLKANNPPVAYTATPYFGLHAFRLVDGKGQGRWVRWHFSPRDAAANLDDAALAAAPANFLEPRLQERVAKGSVKWDMIVTLAEAGDTLTDPSIPWPAGRKEVRVGTLELDKVESQAGGSCDKINFDPMVMSDGVEPSDDPILRFRSAAYAVSFGKRLSDAPTK